VGQTNFLIDYKIPDSYYACIGESTTFGYVENNTKDYILLRTQILHAGQVMIHNVCEVLLHVLAIEDACPNLKVIIVSVGGTVAIKYGKLEKLVTLALDNL